MRFFKKLFLALPIIALALMFLYGRKQDVSKSLKDEPKCDKVMPVEPITCDPCADEVQKKSYSQGYPICENDLPKAYNAAARIDVCGGLDTYITASFIYWESLSDQIDLAIVETGAGTERTLKILKFDTEYEPGFKVGLGTHFNHDNWDGYVQYTRLHQSESNTFKTGDETQTSFRPFWTVSTFGNVVGDTKARWRMDLDKIDIELGRSYYVGTNLIFRPLLGVDVHWIDQKYSFDSEVATTGILNSSIKNDSWGVGPRFGLNMNWFFYKGFKLFGNLAIDLMFASNEASGSVTQGVTNYSLQKYKKYIVRDVEEGAIGFGWGSYFTNDKWHFDISAAYEIQRYSHTNYMNKYSQAFSSNFATKQIKPGDLFLHGLTVTTRFDF
ncbi:hypothetical protein LCGC14_2500350 [marine sediment metagenome]|uniref:Uncharacterized protein n=1 Tax=marine sediment metagenome TaxID=412755 RepID=A0A0F9BQ56_9ZZZZ|nr:hypothetical protein [Chlamydiota bacterium]